MVQSVENNKTMSSNDNREGYRRLSITTNANLPIYPRIDYHHLSNHNRTKRIRLPEELNQQNGEVDDRQQSRRLFGLRLTMTPSFINQIDQMELAQEWQKVSFSTMAHVGPQPIQEKQKATNFPATVLKIGNWERVSKHEGHLVAKCYFAKRKLVWEILEGALKSKIEIQWSEIEGIRAIILDNEPGILEIELNQPPSFFRESDPEPRKHTQWQPLYDFTGGQASVWRRHYMRFAPGILDKHYEKLLQYDSRLYTLSQKPFPSQVSPYFGLPEPCNLSQISFGQIRPPYLQEPQHSHHRNYPKPLISNHVQNLRLAAQARERAMSSSGYTMSVMNLTHRTENAINNGFQHNRRIMPRGDLSDHFLQGPIYGRGFYENHHHMNHVVENPRVSNPDRRALDETDNHLMNRVEDTRPEFNLETSELMKHIENELFSDIDDDMYIGDAQSMFPWLEALDDVEPQVQSRLAINRGDEIPHPQPSDSLLLRRSSTMEPQVGSNHSIGTYEIS